VPEGYSDRKYKHVPVAEYEEEYNKNLMEYIRNLQSAKYNATAPRVRRLVRAAVNKRHGYPIERKPGKERKPTAWNAYTKEMYPRLKSEGYNFADAMSEISKQWKIDKGYYVGLHELRQLEIR
jgi:hypothetical protein